MLTFYHVLCSRYGPLKVERVVLTQMNLILHKMSPLKLISVWSKMNTYVLYFQLSDPRMIESSIVLTKVTSVSFNFLWVKITEL